MRPLSSSAGTALRTWTKHSLTSTSRVAVPSITATFQQRRQQSGEVSSASFDSPFQSGPSTTKIPNFKPYMSGSSETSNRVIQYFMVGTMGLLAAAGAKATVQGMDTQDARS
jgi:ubiquinol-cytochrome c reductase iron-sulfur subunit